MTGPAPPFPTRHKGQIPVTELLAKASRSLLDVWGEEMFHSRGTVLDVLGQRLMVFNRPEAVEQVLVTQADSFAAKPAQLRKCLAPLMGEGLFIAEGAGWRGRRPATAAATACPAPPRAIAAVAAEWRDLWRTRPAGARIELVGAMEACAAELLCRMLFGAAGGRAASAELARLAAAYRGKISGKGLITMLALPESLARMRVSGEARRIHGAVDRLVEGARRLPDHPMARLAEAPGMTKAMLRQEAISLLAMGLDALAGLLAAAWFLLALSPKAEAGLHAELAEQLGGRPPEAEDIARLPVTRALLLETLRLYPPVPLLMRVAARETEVAGVPVPAGSLACVAPWVIHRHQALWDAPDEFRPARFMPDAPAPKPFAYLPFGLGPRHCVGKEMTVNMAMLLLATLAQEFRLHLTPGPLPVPRAGLTLRLAERLPMRLERR